MSLQNGTDEFVESGTGVTIIRTATIIFIIMSAVVGNLLTLVILYKKEYLHTTTSVFVANLAIADLLNGLLTMPIITGASIANKWPFGDVFCQVSAYFTVQSCLTSVLTLCAIAIERYHSIVNPLTYDTKMSKRNVILLVSWTWVQSFIFAILPIVGWGKYIYFPGIFACVTPFGEFPAYTLTLFATCFFIPYTITVMAYVNIGKITVRHLGRRVNKNATCTTTGGIEHSRVLRSDVRSALVFAAVIGTYTVCWLPYLIFMICHLFDVMLPNSYMTAAAWMALLNSACNPLIYGLMNRQYRKGFQDIIRRHRLQRK